MSSGEKGIAFYLNILEISGKHVSNTYVSNLQKYMNDRGLKYKFEIVADEDFFVKHKHTTRGGNSTFPYKHFESAFDNITNIVSFNKDDSNIGIKTTQTDSIEPDEIVNIDYSKQLNDDSVDSVKVNDNDKINEVVDETNKPTDTIIDRLMVYKPLELDGITRVKQSTLPLVKLNIPDDYDGVIHILLTIYVNKTKDIIQGGITQLNHFLTTIA